ncbi:MAG: hypothetical protein JWP92_1447 [Caulobacter sp.]|nr:hypothetical protein [Caulobacter sp.]
MRKFIIRLTGVASLALAALPVIGLTQAAQAAPAEPVARVVVSDLDLSKPAQAAVLDARIHAAGTQFCKAREAIDSAKLSIPRASCLNFVRNEMLRQLPKAESNAVRYASRAPLLDVAAR